METSLERCSERLAAFEARRLSAAAQRGKPLAEV
jgi:hypothetical protein